MLKFGDYWCMQDVILGLRLTNKPHARWCYIEGDVTYDVPLSQVLAVWRLQEPERKLAVSV
jgi:hypothetical protein